MNASLGKYTNILAYAGYKALKPYGGKWTPAKQVNNLISVHNQYKTQIPAIKIDGLLIGITKIGFCKFKAQTKKNQLETIYTSEGRSLYKERTGKTSLAVRVEELCTDSFVEITAFKHKHPRYNFEYLMNRAYAYNRDKGKCRVCGEIIQPGNLHTHHKDPTLPLSKVNKVSNLISTHVHCHTLIHSKSDLSHYSKKVATGLRGLREKLI